jgi:hypothetical protein
MPNNFLIAIDNNKRKAFLINLKTMNITLLADSSTVKS